MYYKSSVGSRRTAGWGLLKFAEVKIDDLEPTMCSVPIFSSRKHRGQSAYQIGQVNIVLHLQNIV